MKKLYYSIGEVSKMTGVEAHVLRYWETRFKELSPSKNRAGKRVYTDSDITTVFELKKLIKEDRFSTEGAKKALKSDTDGNLENQARLKKDLSEIRQFLLDLSERL